MGRKTKAAKLETTANMNMLENSNLPLEIVNSEPKMDTNSTLLSPMKKASKGRGVIARRSGRIQNLTPRNKNQVIEQDLEEINLVESEEEDEPHVEKEDELHVQQYTSEPTSGERSSEEKTDYHVQTVVEFKSKVNKRHFSSESPLIDLNYKSLYIDSQKKIEDLTNENHKLVKKLEFANGKLEVYEKVKDLMENFKDVILISNLTKATEAVVNLSSQAMLSKISSPNVVAEPLASPAKKNKISSPVAVAELQPSPAKKKKRGKESK